MNFKYKWKNGSMPSRDQAARSRFLLDKEQFDNEKDRKLAEEQARKHLGVPTRIPDDERSILPQAGPSGSEDDVNEF